MIAFAGLVLLAGVGAEPAAPPAPVPDALIGVWEPVDRSKGGIGAVIELTRDGRYIQTMTALGDGFYRIDGDRIFFRNGPTAAEDPKEAVRFAIDGDSLTFTGPDGSTTRRERIGAAPAGGPTIVGTWHDAYADSPRQAYERYGADSRFEFRVPMASETSTYRVEGDTLVFVSKSGVEHPVMFQARADFLLLCQKGRDEGIEMHRIGATSWYDRDVDNLAAKRALDPQVRLKAADDALAGATTADSRWSTLASAALLNAELGSPERATALANEVLETANHRAGDWNTGNAIHKGNLALGLVALHAGNVAEAKSRLLAAGKTPGSPQLDSFGPNMTLAKELLQKGEKDAVLQYFELCRKFWKMDHGALDRWEAQIRAGSVPDFGANLIY